MKQSEINKLEMMVATNDYMDAHSPVWNSIPIIGTYKNELTVRVDAIKAAAIDQVAAKVYIGKSIRQNKVNISEKMDAMDDLMEAYAEDTGNAELQQQAANYYSDYLRLPHEEFELKVQNVVSLLETHVADMADYGLSSQQIDDVKLQFNEFQAQRGKPRSYKIASKVATQTIENLFDESSTYLKKLDKVMKRFRRSNATFYSGYKAARTVIDK